jgi:hypothetical protein
VVFSMFTELFNYQHFVLSDYLITSKANKSPFSFPPAPGNHQSTSVHVGLCILNISHKWNHAMCVLCLTSFTLHRAFKVHPCSTCQHFIPDE